MRLRFGGFGGALRGGRIVVLLAIVWAFAAPAAPLLAADPPPPATAAAAAPSGDRDMMSSAGWLEEILVKLENEARSDIKMLPDTPAAIVREWRSFDRAGSPFGALVNVGWVALAAGLALIAEKAVARGLGYRLRRGMQLGRAGPTMSGLMLLLLYDAVGLAVFAGVIVYSRHWLMDQGVTITLMLLAATALIRWRLAVLVVNALLRPHDPAARLIELPDPEARRLARFLSAAILAVVTLVGFGGLSLADEDSGAHHIIGLIVAAAVCVIYALIVYRARAAAEALIRGRGTGLVAALRAAAARAWLAIGLTGVVGLLVFFWFGLSLGLLAYYDAAVSTIGIVFVLLVLEKLAQRGSAYAEPAVAGGRGGIERLVGHSCRRVLGALTLIAAAMALVWTWTDAALADQPSMARQAIYSAAAALGTLFAAYIAWELARLAIDRHLQSVAVGPRMPGREDDDAEAAPRSRLATILPLLRAAFGVLIAVLTVLIVLSRLGVDTAPLIAGAGVFGLAISFGSQSLVRDIISGLFYMWDDAFRLGEYIDTGRLKGTVETLGIRSVKVRHHNGPLHTIPYGQLGAVTNLSRDFATIKFNVRLERNSDIELVRKTAKRIGIDMQERPEIATEVILPLKMQGIAEVADTAVVVRFKFTARPVKPSWVQREYLKSMYRVFADKGIRFASGALTLRTDQPGIADADSGPLPLAQPAPSATVLPAPSRVA